MTDLSINGYQGQICSSDFLNGRLPTSTALFDGSSSNGGLNQYIAKIGIFAPPGAQFLISQTILSNTTTAIVEIGQTFMYEAYDTHINSLRYLGNKYHFHSGQIVASTSTPSQDYHDDNQIQSLPTTNDKRIIIDYVAMPGQ